MHTMSVVLELSSFYFCLFTICFLLSGWECLNSHPNYIDFHDSSLKSDVLYTWSWACSGLCTIFLFYLNVLHFEDTDLKKFLPIECRLYFEVYLLFDWGIYLARYIIYWFDSTNFSFLHVSPLSHLSIIFPTYNFGRVSDDSCHLL